MLALLDRADPLVADEAEAHIAAKAADKLRPIAAAKQDVRIVVESDSKIVVPLPARMVSLMLEVLDAMAEQTPISLIPHDAELTTQQAADFLNVSRPFLVSLLDRGEIDHRMVGSHRRVKYGELLKFDERSRRARREAIEELAAETRRLGLD